MKNKIESSLNILEFLKSRNYKNSKNLEKIREEIIGRLFYFEIKKYKVEDIKFDRTCSNTSMTYDQKYISIVDYYKLMYKCQIKDRNQPLILTYKKGPQDSRLYHYYIP